MSQTVLITGATSGIGLHLAEVFARDDYRVLAVGRTMDKLDAMITRAGFSDENIMTMRLDVQDYADWEAAIQRVVDTWGSLDILINNAGVVEPAYIQDVTPESIRRMLDTNVTGAIYGAQLAAQRMIAQGYGHIINIGSLGGMFPLPGSSVYAASKFALRGFSYSIAVELRAYGVHVSCIMPDSVDTPQHHAEALHDAAAMSFQSAQALTVDDMEQAVRHVIQHKNVELAVPRLQGWLAKLAMSLTGITWRIFPMLLADARKNQAKARAKLNQT